MPPIGAKLVSRLQRRPRNHALSAHVALTRQLRRLMPQMRGRKLLLALTRLKESSHLRSADVDPSLVVDYNESTPSPHSDDEERGGEATPIPSSPISPNLRQ